MKANYHTHLSLCGHAEGMCEDYVKIAIEEGSNIVRIGTSIFGQRNYDKR